MSIWRWFFGQWLIFVASMFLADVLGALMVGLARRVVQRWG